LCFSVLSPDIFHKYIPNVANFAVNSTRLCFTRFGITAGGRSHKKRVSRTKNLFPADWSRCNHRLHRPENAKLIVSVNLKVPATIRKRTKNRKPPTEQPSNNETRQVHQLHPPRDLDTSQTRAWTETRQDTTSQQQIQPRFIIRRRPLLVQER
jgi:hypothetical protein